MAASNHNRKILSREFAREKGLKKYYTGKQCSNGHKAQRYVNSNKCVLCVSGTPIISSHLRNLAAVAAKIQGIHHDTIPPEPSEVLPTIKINND